MADDTLRMAAEIVDKWSGPLREMQKAVRNVSEAAKKYNVEGERHTVSHTNKLFLLRREWNALGSTVRSIMSPALAELSLGFGGISASAAGVGIAIAAAIAAVKDFGKSSTSILNVSNQTKMLKEQVLAWQIAGDGMGLSIDTINTSLKSFGALMDQTNRRSVYAFSRWQEMPGLFEALGGNQFTQMKNRMAQTRHAIDVVQTIPDADKRRRAYAILGLPEDIAGFSKEQIDRLFKAASDAVASGADKIDWEKGFDANVAFTKIGGQLDILKKRIQGGIVGIIQNATPPAGQFPTEMWKNLFSPSPKSLLRQSPVPQAETTPGGAGILGAPLGRHLSPKPSTQPEPEVEIGPLRHPKPGELGPSGALEEFRKAVEAGTEKGTEKGIFAGLRQYASFTPGGGGEGEGSVIPAGYHSMALPRGGGGGGGGGRTARLSPEDTTADVPTAGKQSGDSLPSTPTSSGDAGAGLQGSEYLRARRQRFADELKENPALKERLAAVASLENEGAVGAVSESLFNRLDYAGGTVKSGIEGGRHGSFYGPVRRGWDRARIAQLRRDPKRMARIMRGIDAALAGSNQIQGATDQGSGSDPNAWWPGGRMKIHGETFNDWAGGPGGHAGARSFRERQQRFIRGEGRSTGEQFGPPAPPEIGKGSSLLNDARGAGVLGKLDGSASIELSLAGFPSGLKSQMSAEGMFKDVKLNRGFANNPASEDG